MIKFSAGGRGMNMILGFGLSRANINALLKGRPIKANIDELGLKNVDILIYFGETEEAMQAELKGVITESTRVVNYKKGVEN